jgi:hypothetical protein
MRRGQKGARNAKNHAVAPASCFNRDNSGPIRFPVPFTPRRQRLQRANNDLEFDGIHRI